MPILMDEAGLRGAFAHVKLDILEQAQSTAQLFTSAQADLVATVSAVHLATLLAVMECQPPPQPNNTQVCTVAVIGASGRVWSWWPWVIVSCATLWSMT